MESLGFWLGFVAAILTIIGFVAQFWNRLKGVKVRLGGNKFIFALLICSFILSAIAIRDSTKPWPDVKTVTISAYDPAALSPIRVVRDKSFDNTDVPLDGYDYDHVTFTNVCLLYDGGSYQLQNVTFKDHWRICVKDDRLKNYFALADALGLLDSRTTKSSRSVLKYP